MSKKRDKKRELCGFSPSWLSVCKIYKFSAIRSVTVRIQLIDQAESVSYTI